MQFERGQLNRRDAMNAERDEEEPIQTGSLKRERFPTDQKLNLLCVHRVSAVSFRLPLLHRDGLDTAGLRCRWRNGNQNKADFQE